MGPPDMHIHVQDYASILGILKSLDDLLPQSHLGSGGCIDAPFVDVPLKNISHGIEQLRG